MPHKTKRKKKTVRVELELKSKKIIRIEPELDSCKKCIYKSTRPVPGHIFALSFICTKKGNRVTSEHVEWDSDINEIPDWCPLLVIKLFKK